MKINYYAYLDPHVHHGGGEQVLRRLLNTGEKRGHEIRKTTISPKRQNEYDSPDLAILADIFNNPRLYQRFSPALISNITDKFKYIHFDNAYVDVCNLDYLPCSGAQETVCHYKRLADIKRIIRTRDFSRACFQQNPIVRSLYTRSALNVFVSPLHQRTVYKMLALDNSHDYFILKPIIDGDVFYNKNLERDIEYLYVGVICEAKGLEKLRSEYGNANIVLAGQKPKNERLDFGTHLGMIPYEEIPNVMNRARNFVYLPRWPEPQGRVVIEAALCGCDLIANDNVGATSFDFDISDSANFQNADEEFWQVLENL